MVLGTCTQHIISVRKHYFLKFCNYNGNKSITNLYDLNIIQLVCIKKIHIIQQFINVLDCGIPMNKEGIAFENIHDSDAIGIQRKMHFTCLDGYEREGSEVFICQTNGVWKSDLKCNKKCTFDYFISFY